MRDRRFLALALRIGPSFSSYFFSQRCHRHRPQAKGARARKGRASLPGRRAKGNGARNTPCQGQFARSQAADVHILCTVLLVRYLVAGARAGWIVRNL